MSRLKGMRRRLDIPSFGDFLKKKYPDAVVVQKHTATGVVAARAKQLHPAVKIRREVVKSVAGSRRIKVRRAPEDMQGVKCKACGGWGNKNQIRCGVCKGRGYLMVPVSTVPERFRYGD